MTLFVFQEHQIVRFYVGGAWPTAADDFIQKVYFIIFITQDMH